MKKLFASLLCILLLFSAVACNDSSVPVPPADTPPSNNASTSHVGGADDPSSITTDDGIQNRSHLLEGKTNEECAAFLWNNWFEDEELDSKVSSATMNMNVSLQGTVQGFATSTDANVTSLLVEGNSLSRPFYYQSGTTNMAFELNGTKQETTLTIKSGYADGKIFEYSSGPDGTYAIYAEHSPAEWEEYQGSTASEDDILPTVAANACSTKTFERKQKEFVIGLSGFSEEEVIAFSESFGGLGNLIDQIPSDVSLSATFRHDLLPTEIKIAFVYDETSGNNAPVCEITIELKDYNKTKAFSMDWKDYRNVGNLLYAKRILESPQKLLEAHEATYSCWTIKYIYQSGTEIYSDGTMYHITHKNKADGSFVFEIQDFHNESLSYRYSDGIYQVRSGSSNRQYEMSDEEARDIIQSLVMPTELEILWTKATYYFEFSGFQDLLYDYDADFSTCDPDWIDTMLNGTGKTSEDVMSIDVNASYRINAEGKLIQVSYYFDMNFADGYRVEYSLQMDISHIV